MPTLFTGEDIPEARVEGLPDRDVFGARGVDRATRGVGSCALVSNSGALKGANLGAEVDAHDLVFRFNNAPTKGYEADVGSKTSVRYTNAAFQGFRERDDEAVMAKWCNEFKRCPDQRHIDELSRLNEKKVHAVNPAFLQYIDNRYFKAKRERPSSGMVMAVMLMHVCRKVTLFGFSGSSIKAWYFPKRPGGKALPKKQWMRERRWTVEKWNFGSDGGKVGGSGLDVRRLLALDSGPDQAAGLGMNRDAAAANSSAVSETDAAAVAVRRRGWPGRHLLHAVGAERHCMQQLVSANLVTMRP